MLLEEQGRLVFQYDAETLWIEQWGQNALRVRATKQSTIPDENWALSLTPQIESKCQITISETSGSIMNGEWFSYSIQFPQKCLSCPVFFKHIVTMN